MLATCTASAFTPTMPPRLPKAWAASSLPELPATLSVSTFTVDDESAINALALPPSEADGLAAEAAAFVPPLDDAQQSRATTARISLALVAATYGSNYACVKLLDEWVGESSVASCLRFAIACAVMLPALGYCGWQDARYLRWPFARDGLVTGSWFAAGYCAQAVALETSPAGVQAFLLALSVLVCPMLEQLVEGKQQPRRVWFAALLAAAGVAALELDGLSHGSLARGDLIGLLQPLFFGAGFFECARAMERHQRQPTEADEHGGGGGGGADLLTPVALTAWQLCAVLGLTGVWAASAGDGAGLEHVAEQAMALGADPAGHAAVVGTLLWTGLGTTAGCSLVEAAALGELSSADATVVFATEPLWGAVFAFLLLGEHMGPQCQLGGLLMCAACVVSATDGSVADVVGCARAAAAAALARVVETAGGAAGFSPRRSRAVARKSIGMRIERTKPAP